MRLKIPLILLVAILSLMLIGCGRAGKGESTGNLLQPDTKPGQVDSSSQDQLPGDTPGEVAAGGPDTPVQSPAPGQEDKPATRASIAGIHLGDSREDVQRILGDKYQETLIDEMAYYGEKLYIMKYDAGIEVLIGRDSLEVLDIMAYSPAYATDLGVKVGDSAKDVLAIYRTKYKEPQSRHGSGTLEGWFEVEDGVYLIFDFNKSDGSLVNGPIKDNDRVEMIRLIHSFYLD
ncbi:hypothetical protein [Moorella sulfitireducens (nom. illeg.)]|uniref:hypothetical protein n=1 Tax=Neomoorella sulfitireducens TaxID=2972948 RepID=UPI0021AC7101|nr:hypothetical protein [Moorella sulfitireducens]